MGRGRRCAAIEFVPEQRANLDSSGMRGGRAGLRVAVGPRPCPRHMCCLLASYFRVRVPQSFSVRTSIGLRCASSLRVRLRHKVEDDAMQDGLALGAGSSLWVTTVRRSKPCCPETRERRQAGGIAAVGCLRAFWKILEKSVRSLIRKKGLDAIADIPEFSVMLWSVIRCYQIGLSHAELRAGFDA